jgi:hypothetical protein
MLLLIPASRIQLPSSLPINIMHKVPAYIFGPVLHSDKQYIGRQNLIQACSGAGRRRKKMGAKFEASSLRRDLGLLPPVFR